MRQTGPVTIYAKLKCQAVRWVNDEPIPGWIEVVMTDSEGREWRFFDKSVMFGSSNEPITSKTLFPVETGVIVAIIENGDPVTVSTAPAGIESEEGETLFRVSPGLLDHHNGDPVSQP